MWYIYLVISLDTPHLQGRPFLSLSLSLFFFFFSRGGGGGGGGRGSKKIIRHCLCLCIFPPGRPWCNVHLFQAPRQLDLLGCGISTWSFPLIHHISKADLFSLSLSFFFFFLSRGGGVGVSKKIIRHCLCLCIFPPGRPWCNVHLFQAPWQLNLLGCGISTWSFPLIHHISKADLFSLSLSLSFFFFSLSRWGGGGSKKIIRHCLCLCIFPPGRPWCNVHLFQAPRQLDLLGCGISTWSFPLIHHISKADHLQEIQNKKSQTSSDVILVFPF